MNAGSSAAVSAVETAAPLVPDQRCEGDFASLRLSNAHDILE